MSAQLWAERGESTRLYGILADEHTLSNAISQARYIHLATHGFFENADNVYRGQT
jgi:hypothetical protein